MSGTEQETERERPMKQDSWISVSKDLPELDLGRVLTSVRGSGFRVQTIGAWTGKKWIFDRAGMDGEVTHWMKLPRAPLLGGSARAADPLREELVQALEMVQSEFECVVRNTNRGVRYGGAILFSDQTKEKVRAVLAKAKAGQP